MYNQLLNREFLDRYQISIWTLQASMMLHEFISKNGESWICSFLDMDEHLPIQRHGARWVLARAAMKNFAFPYPAFIIAMVPKLLQIMANKHKTH